jgi:MarR family transcriptional regulator, organic hydroperoxide resistance regulator
MDSLFEFALLLKAIQRELERQMNDAMRPLGLTAAQADALSVIGQAGPLSLKELGELLIAEAGHPSRLVDRLVEADLVARRAGDHDRRRVELSLTAQGRRLEKRLDATRQRFLNLAREILGDRDLEPALRLLRDLLQYTSFAELVARRRDLLEAGKAGRRSRSLP